MNLVVYAIVALVALQRLVELRYAERNTARLIARGGVEVGREHYWLIVLLHTSWLVAILIAVPAGVHISWLLIAAFVVLQAGRVWVIASLGPYWTTRIITLPDVPLVRRGPYRFIRHPNYVIVALEIAVLPLAFGEYWVALAFSVSNAAMLAWRIRQEESVLAPRRVLAADGAVHH